MPQYQAEESADERVTDPTAAKTSRPARSRCSAAAIRSADALCKSYCVRNLVHLIYSTKDRHPWNVKEVRKHLYAYQAGIFKDCQSQSILIGGVADHVHALFALTKNWSLADVVEEVKKGQFEMDEDKAGIGDRDSQWQASYAAFSMSPSQKLKVTPTLTVSRSITDGNRFRTNLLALLNRHRVEYDERYLWD